jgi:outer membrane protease
MSIGHTDYPVTDKGPGQGGGGGRKHRGLVGNPDAGPQKDPGDNQHLTIPYRYTYSHDMKTITGFMFFVSIWYMFFIVPSLSAETETEVPRKVFPYTFSVSSLAGLIIGQGEEIVYKYETGDVYLSELLWELKPLFYAGSLLSFSQANPWEKFGFFGDLSLKFGVSRYTGTVEDRDWASGENDNLTNFSSHDSYTDGALLLDVSTGLSFPMPIGPLFKMFIGCSFMRFKWTAHDGYYQYAKELSQGVYEEWDESIEKKAVYGPVMAYSQQWVSFTLGSSLHIPLSAFFTLGFSFQMGPMVFCVAQDDHLLSGKQKQFVDFVYRGILLEGRGELVFSFRERLALSLYCGYRRIQGGRGESYSRSSGSGGDGTFIRERSFDSAGAGYTALDTGLALKVRF